MDNCFYESLCVWVSHSNAWQGQYSPTVASRIESFPNPSKPLLHPHTSVTTHRTLPAGATPHEAARATVVKACAACLIGLATIKTLPLMASHGVGHTLQLMEAREPFLIKAGISRLNMLLTLESAHPAALQAGAVPRLLRLIDREDVGDDVILAALGTLRRLASTEEGGVALLREGAPAALERVVARVRGRPEDRDGAAVVKEAGQLAYDLLGPMNRVPDRSGRMA